MTREAELKARDFVALVMAGVHAETEVGVVQRLLLQAQTALGSYADPEWARSNGLAGVRRPAAGTGTRSRAGFGSPAGVRQRAVRLGAVGRTTSRCCGAAGHRTRSGQGLPGLVIDTDLRWRIVTALAAAGDIDADGPGDAVHRRRGRSATRPRRASGTPRRPSAARPQPAVKEEAWQQVIEDDTLANITARSIIGGFVARARTSCWQPFRDKYFGAIPGVWERRSSEVAQTVVIGLYPSWDISQAAWTPPTSSWPTDVPPALRRLVVEGRAGVERALRAREFDATS